VNRLLDAYRTDGDPASRVAALSAYLRHVNPGKTYWYLHAAPELLELAGGRLERHLGGWFCPAWEKALGERRSRVDASVSASSRLRSLGTSTRRAGPACSDACSARAKQASAWDRMRSRRSSVAVVFEVDDSRARFRGPKQRSSTVGLRV
jgi:hypothetical protein